MLPGAALCSMPDADGRTPLWLATHNGHAEAVRVLLSGGASANGPAADVVDPFTKTTVWRQCSALWTSVHCGHGEVSRHAVFVSAVCVSPSLHYCARPGLPVRHIGWRCVCGALGGRN